MTHQFTFLELFWFRALLINKLQFNNQTHYNSTPSYKTDPKNLQRCPDCVVCEERFVSHMYGTIFCRLSAFNVTLSTENVGIVQTFQCVKGFVNTLCEIYYSYEGTLFLSILILFVFILNRKNKKTLGQMRRNSTPARRGGKEIH